MTRKCCLVAIIGEPNAGKSTLTNLMVGEKISIVSNKVQTTRRLIKGISVIDETQIVFIDSPGFGKANSSLEKALRKNFRCSYNDADVVLMIIDASARNYSASIDFIQKFRKNPKQIFAVAINKVDIANKENLLKIADILSKYSDIKEIFMISALKNDGVDSLRQFICCCAHVGNWIFPGGVVTDLNMQLRLADITREKLFGALVKELPYCIYVETELVKYSLKKATIYQAIVVMKNSQKGIIIGKDALMIKRIKFFAIKDMALLLDKKIDLKIFVKVKEKWPDKTSHLLNAGIVD
ncbi:GTPase Era [Alphaproteobacteria bacterium]|nr:GTPase Era [Alphaproteobacteria bacterium]